MAEYKVQFEVFEGPLDLLLYLVKKEEVDIYQVNLTRLATQFIEYVELMRQLDLDIAGECLVMASTLMYLKSRELLPVEQQATPAEEEEEGDDPRWELIRKLVEYKKFKDAAADLHALELEQEHIYPRQPPKLEFERPATRPEVSIFDLVGAVGAILKRVQSRGEARDIFEDKWSVSEKIDHIRTLLTNRPAFTFSELFGPATSRSEVVATFLAVLELIRLRHIVARQAEAFGEIEIAPAPAPTSVAAPTDPAEAAPASTPPAAEAPSSTEPAAPAASADEPPAPPAA